MIRPIDLVDKADSVSVRKQCKILSVNRSSLYIEPKGENEYNESLMKLIDIEHMVHPTKGALQMTSYLNQNGHNVNVKRVRRLMRLMEITAIYPKVNLSKLGKAEYIKPYLLRKLKIKEPNQVWAIDISYIPMRKGFMYLTALIDLKSRYIVGWNISNTLEAKTQTELVTDSIEKYGKPNIINSDQGSQYTSEIWTKCLKYHEVLISMDGKGRATDNAFIERFFRTIKQEYIYLNPEENSLDLYKGIERYIDYYNTKRPHQGLNDEIPINIYQKLNLQNNKNLTNIAKELV